MLPAEKITERMATLEPVAMRLEVKEGKNGCLLINDSYNSDLASLDIALDFLYRRSQSNGLKRNSYPLGYTGNRTEDARHFYGKKKVSAALRVARRALSVSSE